MRSGLRKEVVLLQRLARFNGPLVPLRQSQSAIVIVNAWVPKRWRCFAAASSSSWISPSSRAAIYHAHGPPHQVVRLVDVPGSSLQDKDVCVKILAAPINPSDINRIEGVYPVRPPLPAVGGSEGVGVVIATGSKVKNLSVDDHVIPASAGLGTWRSFVVKEEDAWCKVSKDVAIEYAASVTVNPCTAFRLLEDFVKLQPGDAVVQNGATSMVGQCLIQLAHLQNIRTINIVRDRTDLVKVKDYLKGLGATLVISEGEFTKEILSGVGNAKLGFNCVGGAAATMVMKALREGGTMVTYGGMSKKPITVSTSSQIFKNIHLQGFWLQKWLDNHTREEFMAMIDHLLKLVKDGKLVYSMENVPFSEFPYALAKAMGQHGSCPKQMLIFD